MICKPHNMEVDQPHTGVSTASGLAFAIFTQLFRGYIVINQLATDTFYERTILWAYTEVNKVK